jgi:signal transduction histidine kinase
MSKTNWAFFLITFTGSLWLFTFGWLVMSRTNENAQFWNQLDYTLAVPFISPCVYLFAVRWAEESPRRTFVPYIFFVACVFSAIAWFFPDRMADFGMHEPWGRFNRFKTETRFGLIYISSLLTFFTMVAAAAFQKLWREYSRATSTQRKIQYRNFLLAFVVGYCGSTDFLVALNQFSIPLGAISFGFFALLVAYSIMRYQFLDVNIARQKLLIVFLIYALLFSLLLPPVSYQLHQAIRHNGINVLASFLPIAVLVGMVFSMGPLLYAFLTRRDFWLRTATTSGLAHELKSPVAAISGAMDLLAQQIDNSGDISGVKTYVNIIQRNTERLQSYIGDLLSLVHVADCDLLLNRERSDLTAIIERVQNHYEPMAKSKNLAIKRIGAQPCIVDIDPIRVEQAISNLVSNAIRYSDEGEITISISEIKNSILVSVRDNGRGILKQDLERIFTRFYQVDKSGQGSGIGLTIAKTWIEAHGGKIWAESAGKGKGATVTFTLPTN